MALLSVKCGSLSHTNKHYLHVCMYLDPNTSCQQNHTMQLTKARPIEGVAVVIVTRFSSRTPKLHPNSKLLITIHSCSYLLYFLICLRLYLLNFYHSILPQSFGIISEKSLVTLFFHLSGPNSQHFHPYSTVNSSNHLNSILLISYKIPQHCKHFTNTFILALSANLSGYQDGKNSLSCLCLYVHQSPNNLVCFAPNYFQDLHSVTLSVIKLVNLVFLSKYTLRENQV